VPGFHERRQLLAEDLGCRVGDDEVEADIDIALALGLPAIILDAGAQ
jgi:hypothetical protein